MEWGPQQGVVLAVLNTVLGLFARQRETKNVKSLLENSKMSSFLQDMSQKALCFQARDVWLNRLHDI